MIARQAPRVARFRRTCLAGALAGLLPAMAAAEQMPWEEAPVDEPSLWDDPTFDGGATTLPDPGDAAAAPQPVPVDTGPDIPAPRVDAYFDVSFNDTGIEGFGYPSSSSGYRFIVGFLLPDAGNDRVSVAPEVGYFRMNSAERDIVTLDTSDPRWDIETTRHFSADISSLDFGARLGLRLGERLTVFSRMGLAFYHTVNREQVTLSYTEKNATPPPDETQRPASVSDAGLAPFASLGAAVSLGQVPSLYVEYGSRLIDGEAVDTASLGFLLNF